MFPFILEKKILTKTGTNQAKAWREVVQGRIESGTLFPNIAQAVCQAVADISRMLFDELIIGCEQVLSHIMSDVYYVLAHNESHGRHEARMKLEERAFLAHAQHKLERLEKHYSVILKLIEHF